MRIGNMIKWVSGLFVLSLAVSMCLHQAHSEDAAMILGKKVFLELSEPQCALCHTLADAGSTGPVGPVLDELKPTADRIRTAVTKGIGPMPANTILTREQVEAVALYVSTVSGAK